MTGKELGKIEKASFGFGGYQDAQIGLNVTLSGPAWCVQTGWQFWLPTSPERVGKPEFVECALEAITKIQGVLSESKRGTVESLKGCPIQATFEDGILKSWRVLTEVIE